MRPRCGGVHTPRPPAPFVGKIVAGILIVALILIAAVLMWPGSSVGAERCAAMRAYAQASANQMARRDAMGNHDYFRARPHEGGENIGWGYKTEAAMVAAWWRSPGHAANMRLGYPCKVIASARSRSGKLYWAMEVGGR